MNGGHDTPTAADYANAAASNADQKAKDALLGATEALQQVQELRIRVLALEEKVDRILADLESDKRV